MLRGLGRDALQFMWEAAQDGGTNSGGEQTTAPSLEQLQAELEQTRKALKAANAESAQRRKTLEELEATKAKQAEAELTEVQKAQKRAEEAEQRMKQLEASQRESAIRHAVEMAAAKMNFHDVQDAYRLADLVGVDVNDGKVTGVEDALKALATSKPHLIKQPSGGDTNAAARGSQRTITPQDLVEQKRNSGAYTPF